jgi:hypothetical protein
MLRAVLAGAVALVWCGVGAAVLCATGVVTLVLRATGVATLVLCATGVATLVLFATGAAAGDERPVLRPLHDVDVTYELDNGVGSPLHERLRWDAASQRLRVDPPTVGLYVIIDLAARRMSTVRLAERTVIEMAAPDNVTGMPNTAAAAAVRQGADTVAGLGCVEWDMTDAAGEAARLCLTDDGVLLRARAGGRTLLSAETVRYGPVDAGVFQMPAGFAHQKMGPQPAPPKGVSPQSGSPQ